MQPTRRLMLLSPLGLLAWPKAAVPMSAPQPAISPMSSAIPVTMLGVAGAVCGQGSLATANVATGTIGCI